MQAVFLTANQEFDIRNVSLGELAPDSCRVRISNVRVCWSDIHRSHASGAYHYP